MKKTRSEKSCDTVPLRNKPQFLICPFKKQTTI
jgi:hypothetical protein